MKRIKESATSNAWLTYSHHQQAGITNPTLLYTSLDSESEELLDLVREGHSPKDAIEIIIRSRPELKSLQEDSLKDEEQDDATKDDEDNKEQDPDDQVPDSSDSRETNGGDPDDSTGDSEQEPPSDRSGGSSSSVSEPKDDDPDSSQSDFKARLLAVGEPTPGESESGQDEDGESDDETDDSGNEQEDDEPSDTSSDADSSGDSDSEEDSEDSDDSEEDDDDDDDDSEEDDDDDDDDDSESDEGDRRDDEEDSDDDDEDDSDDEERSSDDEGEEAESPVDGASLKLISIGDPKGYQDQDNDGLQDIAPPPRDDLTDLGRNAALDQEEEATFTEVHYEGESPTVPGSVAWRMPLYDGFRDSYSLALYVTPMTPQENETEDEMYLLHSRVESGMTPVFLDNPRADEDLREEYKALSEKIPQALQPMTLLKASDTLSSKAKRVSLEDLKGFIRKNLDSELSKVARTNLRSIASLTYSSPDIPQAPPTPTSPLEESWNLSRVVMAPRLASKDDFQDLEDEHQFHTNEEPFEVAEYGDDLNSTAYLDDPHKISNAKQGLICPKNPIPGYYKANHNVNLQCRNSSRHLLVRGGELILLSSDPRSDEVIVTVDHREYFRVLPSELEGMYKVDR